MTKYDLSEKWIKASIVGTIWAASEIVLGSFLHNLKVPFSGNVLTGIGIVILISLGSTWRENGLFWRAGLICAIMKTISPSAVIFGPMIAILSESLLLELSVRLFGRTLLGFALGAVLAMTWNLFQRIINLLIFYGLNIIELYQNLIQMAKKQLQIQSNILWLPLIVLLLVYGFLGFISAIVGIRIGKKLQIQPKKNPADSVTHISSKPSKRVGFNFRHSLIWLSANITLLITALYLLNYSSMIYWGSFIFMLSIVWSVRYQRALRQLSKPGFWLFFVCITMLTAFAFSKVQGERWQEGLLIGLQMNFRAVVVVLGFAVLGTELYNPVIRTFFLSTSFKQLPAALELSFESLPVMIAGIPDFRTVFKNPVAVIYQIVSRGEERLQEIKREMNILPRVYLLSGILGGGKTTFVRTVAEILKTNHRRVGGILSVRLTEKEKTIGYDLLDLSTGQTEKFLRIGDFPGKEKIGRYSIFPQGIRKGQIALENSLKCPLDLIVVDEVGKLELQGDGWADSLHKLVGVTNAILLITVRDGFDQRVIEKWQIAEYQIIHVGVTNPELFASRILMNFSETIKAIP